MEVQATFVQDGIQSAQVTYRVTAEDNVDGTATLDENNMLIQDDVGGDIRISCDRLSGSTFPIGETVVECTSTDAAGNTSTASFTVTVNPAPDTTPPTLTVPEDRMVEATSTAGAVVTYTVTAEDNVDGTATLEEDGTTVTQDDVGGDITISCIPRSGSVFPIGRTTVECTATDEAGNTGRASFTITVNPRTCVGVAATMYDTEGNDNIVGTEGRDIIVALGGNDRVQALGGDDAVCGGDGDDTLIGDAGNDVIDGGPNTDTCDAETEFNCET
jgi:Ca2+-binding RTX toxin-like protein